MNIRFCLLFAIVLLFASIAISRDWTPADDDILGVPNPNTVQIQVEKLGSGHLRLTFSNPEVKFEQVTADKRDWTWINLEGETRNWTIGKPSVPSIARPVLFPNTGNVDVRVVSSQYVEFKDMTVLPQQPYPKETKDGYENFPFTIDNDCYTADKWFPEELYQISQPQILRDARMGLLSVQPVSVNPATHTVRVYTSIVLEVVPTGGIGENELLTNTPHPSPAFAQFYRDILGADELTEANATALPGQMIIYCRAGAVATIQPYVNWRYRSGRPTRIDTTTATSEATVFTRIQTAYNSTAGVEMIIVVGDGGTSADDYTFPSYSVSGAYTDHSYVCLAGNDIVADAFISRWSATTVQELATMVNRTLNYERTPNMTDTTWFRRGWGYAGVAHNIISNRTCVWFCMSMMSARGVPAGNINYDEHTGSTGSAQFNLRGNPGMLFQAHRAAYVGEMYPTDVAGVTTNVNKCFVTLNITCSSGNWYGASSTGIHEQWIRNGTPTAPAGALAAMSTYTSSTHPSANNCIAAGTYYGLGVKNARQPAGMFFEGKYHLWRDLWIGRQVDATNFTNWNSVMGDISVNLWTGVPRALTANIPQQISLGQNNLTLRVTRQAGGAPVSNALVTVLKQNTSGLNETFNRGVTDATGTVILPLTNSTIGNLYVTVIGNKVGDNFIPIIDTVAVVTTPSDVVIARYSVTDDTSNGRIGNSNSHANPGETVDLNIRLTNRGTTGTVSGISATMTSTDDRVIVNSTQTYTDLAPSDSAYGAGQFRVQLLAGLRNGDQIPLRLRVTATDTNQNRDLILMLPIESIQMTFISRTLSPTTFNPGTTSNLSITVRNNGLLAPQNTDVRIFSLSPFVTIGTPNVSFPTLPIGQNVSNPANQNFRITSNTRTIPGTDITLGAAFTNGAVHDTLYFTVTSGTRASSDPTGPDTYGYLAYDDTDTRYEMVPTYSWINNVTPANRLNMTDASDGTDASVLIRLPFRARYYGADFDTITVCTNGWFSYGPARVVDAQGQVHLMFHARHWPLPTTDGPKNLVAVDWQDLYIPAGPTGGVYTSYDALNGWYVITWIGTAMVEMGSGANEFQAIIYDPARWPVPSGDCVMKFQYKTRNGGNGDAYPYEVGYTTIGISDSTYTKALQYFYWQTWSAGASPLATGSNVNRAVVFTTSQNFINGTLVGTVTKSSDGSPLAGVTVSAVESRKSAITDSVGHYRISEIQIGSYHFIASKNGYNSATDTVTIREDQTSTVNFSLTAPKLQIAIHPGDTTLAPRDSLYARLTTRGQDTTMHIYMRNTGNGPMTWNAAMSYSGSTDEVDTLWNTLRMIDASTLVGGDPILSGIEFDGEHFWITGATTGYARPHKLYKVDRNFTQLLATYDCPDQTGLIGWRDLAFDGRYLYASYSNFIDKIDTADGSVVSRIPITTISVARAMAVDTVAGVLYYADQASAIYKLRLSDNTVIGSVTSPLGLFGLAWYPADPDGMQLYAFSRDQSGRTRGTRIIKINPTTGASSSLITLGSATENANGLTITCRWNPMFWTVVAMLENPSGTDHIGLFELTANLTWINYGPTSGTLAAGQADTVDIHVSSTHMPAFRYSVAMNVTTNTETALISLPVVMDVVVPDSTSVQLNSQSLPMRYSMEQNYPNPFNPITSITFALPRTSKVKMTILNELGQEVTRLIANETLQAGTHSVTFNGSKLATGIYFYRIEAGSFVSTKKMVLLK